MPGIEVKEAVTEEERRLCFEIRRAVFVDRLGLFEKDDLDEDDFNGSSVHLLALADGRAVGTVRITDEGNGVYRGSRLAVLPEAPFLTGWKLVRKAMEFVRRAGARTFRAFVLPEAFGFFRRCGWVWKGEKTIYAGKEHYIMYARDEG